MKNPWVKYLDRSYSAVKAAVNARLETVVPELTDKSSSNLMQVVVDIFAGVAEMLNYYVDVTARELYLPTARRLVSVLKLASLVGYNGKAAIPSSTTVVLSRVAKAGGAPVALATDVLIPIGFELTDSNGNIWLTEQTATFRAGLTSVALSVAQYSLVTAENLGTTDGTVNQKVLLPDVYAEGSLELTINSQPWTRVEALGFYGASDRVFITQLQVDGAIYIIFGDGTNGAVPTASQVIYGDYHSTKGAEGNAEVATITTVVDQLPGGDPNEYEATNLEPAYGGKDIEGLADLRKAIPLSTRTLDRAVTKKDFEDIAALAPGIRAARVGFTCGPRVNLYLVGDGGGNPSQALLTSTLLYVMDKAICTLAIDAFPSGESHVKGEVTIQGKFRAKTATIQADVQEALVNLYDPSTSKINQPVRVSDVIAAIDNAESVDYLTLNKFYVEPYLRPSNVASVINYSIEVLSGSSGPTVWRLLYNGTTFTISKNGIDQGVTITVGVPASNVGGLIDITVHTAPANAINGDYWDFVVNKYKGDVELTDLSIPVVGFKTDGVSSTGVFDFTLNINETYLTQ